MPVRIRRLAVFQLVILLASAQQPADVKFTSNTNLVIIDVTVLDKSGKAVSNLKKEDFTLIEDRKPQNISVFEFQRLSDVDPTPSAVPIIAAHPVAPSRPRAIMPSQTGSIRYQDKRLVVMLFDMSSMQPEDQVHANEAAIKFLNTQMQASDLVAVMTNTASLQVAHDFTGDKEELIRTIKSFNVGQSSDLAAFGTNGDMTAGEDTGAAFEADDTEFNIFTTDQKLIALEMAAKMLSSLPEKKALIYFSAGISKSGVDNQAQLRSTVNVAVRSNVSFYPIDVRGLVALPPGGDATKANSRGTGMFTGSTQLQQKQSFDDQQETLVTLAEDTGGKAFLDDNDLANGVKSARDDVHSYYILGFYSTNPKEDGKFRHVQVKLNRPGLIAKLDYRDGYYAPKIFKKFTNADRESQLQQALLLGDPVTDIPIAVETDFFRLGHSTYFVPVAVKVPGSVIPLGKKGSKQETQIDFIGQIYNSRGTIVEKLRDYIPVRLDTDTAAQLAKRSLQYDAGFTLQPGQYTIKVLARENQSGKMGTFESKFFVPDLTKAPAGAMPASSVVWSTHRVPVKGGAGGVRFDKKGAASDPLIQDGQKLVPNIAKVFRSDQDLYVYLEVYDPSPTPSVAAEIRFYRGGVKAYESKPVRLTEQLAARPGVMPIRFQVPLSALAPGKYICQVNVIDEKAERYAFPRTTLNIVKKAGASATAAPNR